MNAMVLIVLSKLLFCTMSHHVVGFRSIKLMLENCENDFMEMSLGSQNCDSQTEISFRSISQDKILISPMPGLVLIKIRDWL